MNLTGRVFSIEEAKKNNVECHETRNTLGGPGCIGVYCCEKCGNEHSGTCLCMGYNIKCLECGETMGTPINWNKIGPMINLEGKVVSQYKKYLGKIASADFGLEDRFYQHLGLQLTFQFDGSSNICHWIPCDEKAILKKLLDDAQVSTFNRLVGKPVELTLSGSMFYSFRILTEVL